MVVTRPVAADAVATYSVRNFRAHLAAALSQARATGQPVIVAERGERPLVVVLDIAAWEALMARLASLEVQAAVPPEPAVPAPGWGGASRSAALAGDRWSTTATHDLGGGHS